jgi:hypothetical protein
VRRIYGNNTRAIFLEKRSFIEKVEDIDEKQQRIFVEKGGYPRREPVKFKAEDWRKHTDDLLFIIQEKIKLADIDRSVRPVLLV